MIKFAKLEGDDAAAAELIAERAMAVLRGTPLEGDRVEVMMDITAVHARTPLRLRDFADADDFNFTHDIAGIRHFLNRQTGKLGGEFRPRFAARKPRKTVGA